MIDNELLLKKFQQYNLQTKILLFALGAVAVVLFLILGFIYIRVHVVSKARTRQAMDNSAKVFRFFLETQNKNLLDRFSSVSQEPRLKAGISSQDRDTIDALLGDVKQDTGVSFLMVIDMQGQVGGRVLPPEIKDIPKSFLKSALVRNALGGTKGGSLVMVDPFLCEVAALPINIGDMVVGVLVAGNTVGLKTLENFREMTDTDLALLVNDGVIASTLNQFSADTVKRYLSREKTSNPPVRSVGVGGNEYAMAVHSLSLDQKDVALSYVLLKSMKEERTFMISIQLWTFVIGMIVFGLVAFNAPWITQRITAPILQASRRLEEIAKGGSDLTLQLSVETEDEVGVLARNFNEFLFTLNDMVTVTREQAEKVLQISNETSVSSQKTVRLSQQQSQMMQKIALNSEQVAKDVANAADFGRQSQDQLALGRQEVEHLVAHIERFRAGMEETAGVIESLGRYSAQIEQIVVVIDEIAEQTNLLALNAAIEAARAGEMGLGFSVVAKEVRALSENTKQSTQQISKLVRDLLGITSSSVKRIRISKQQVEQSGLITSKVNERFQNLTEAVDRISSFLSSISVSAKRAASLTEEVSHSSEKQAGSAKEIAVHSHTLTDSAEKLQRSVSQFKTVES